MAGPIRHLLSRNGRYYARVAVPKALPQLWEGHIGIAPSKNGLA